MRSFSSPTLTPMQHGLLLHDRSPIAENFLLGGLAGFSATTLTFPFDLLRTRFATQGLPYYTIVLTFSLSLSTGTRVFAYQSSSMQRRNLSSSSSASVVYLLPFYPYQIRFSIMSHVERSNIVAFCTLSRPFIRVRAFVGSTRFCLLFFFFFFCQLNATKPDLCAQA
jgi:hypothetical protein